MYVVTPRCAAAAVVSAVVLRRPTKEYTHPYSMMHRRLTTAGVEVAPHDHQFLVFWTRYTEASGKIHTRYDHQKKYFVMDNSRPHAPHMHHILCGGHKLGNVGRTVVTHVSMDDPPVGISHRGTFPSPRHIRYYIEPDMPMTETLETLTTVGAFILASTLRCELTRAEPNGLAFRAGLVEERNRIIFFVIE